MFIDGNKPSFYLECICHYREVIYFYGVGEEDWDGMRLHHSPQVSMQKNSH